MKIQIRKRLIPLLVSSAIFISPTINIGHVGNNSNIPNDVKGQEGEAADVTSKYAVYFDEDSNTFVFGIEAERKTTSTLDVQIGMLVETKKVIKAKSKLNLREKPSISSKKIGSIPKNKRLDLVYSDTEGWYKVKFKEGYAYVSAEYADVEEKKSLKAPIEKVVYFPNCSKMYDETLQTKIMDIPQLEAAPVYATKGDYYVTMIDNNLGLVPKKDTETLEGTFVIVDISDQEAYLYENNELVISTPVVTGKDSTPTTKGLHNIWRITHPTVLIGPDYRSPVDYIPFRAA